MRYLLRISAEDTHLFFTLAGRVFQRWAVSCKPNFGARSRTLNMETVLRHHLSLPVHQRGDLAVAGELDQRFAVAASGR